MGIPSHPMGWDGMGLTFHNVLSHDIICLPFLLYTTTFLYTSRNHRLYSVRCNYVNEMTRLQKQKNVCKL